MRLLIPALFFLSSCATAPAGGLERIETIVVIYAENRSFDHLYGLFPGANGIADATDEQKTQLDLDGTELPHLPPVFTPQGKPDERFPRQLPNGPFRIDAPPLDRRWDELLPSPIHAYYQNREQINGGRNNLYVAMSNAGAFVMGYFDGSRMRLWKWAQDYTLAAKGVSWAWYAGGWNAAIADGRRDPKDKRTVIYAREGSFRFQPHHQPFNYFERFAPGTAERAGHLKDYDDLVTDIDRGTLPRVVFYKPTGRLNQHPSYTDLAQGDAHLDDLLRRLRSSRQWPKMAVIVTYDENGGYWDHAPPPSGPGWSDRWGPGTRVPALIVSPFAKRGFVDKSIYDTTSVLKLIQRRFGLEPLPGVRANVGDLTNAFAF